MDFEAETFVSANAFSPETAIDATPTAVMNLSANVTPNSAKPLFLALGIEFYQQINGALYSLKNGAYNALAIVEVPDFRRTFLLPLNDTSGILVIPVFLTF